MDIELGLAGLGGILPNSQKIARAIERDACMELPDVRQALTEAKTAIPSAQHVSVSDEALTVELEDGRMLSAPLGWYPRLAHAKPEERNRWRLIGQGTGIHWDALDEDISIEGLLLGKRSGESQHSFQRWLAAREG